MGVDQWTRESHEQKLRARERDYSARKRAGKTGDQRSAADKLRDRLNGTHHRCACGCGKEGTYFRDRKLYNKDCVGRGSKWSASGLPQDRTPPLSGKRKREINRSSRG